jgi:hypothetical protein
MSINQHQFEQLTEMGISLWQSRTYDNHSDTTKSNTPNYLEIDLTALASQQLFIDILLATGLTIGEISHQGDHLDLGLFNWYFTATASQDKHQDKIRWQDQQLVTPSIADISKSPALKKQLWHLLGKQAQ